MDGVRAWPVAIVVAVAAGLLPGGAALAQVDPGEDTPKWIDEVRVGLLAHDVGIGGHDKESGEDFNLEVLFPTPRLLVALGQPRPHIGASINTNRDTDQYYFGLTWTLTVIEGLFRPQDGLFVALSLGGAAHNGRLGESDPDRKALGSRLLFRESVEIGYRLDRWISVSVMLDHVSNARLADHNEGLTSIGGRLGFRF